MSRMLREVWLFFWRDLIIARSYRTVFVLEAMEAFFGTATLYYVARLVDSAAVRQELPQGESYFAFSLVGYVFLDYLNAALNTFDNSLVEARDSGTLEHVLVTQTSLPVFLAGSSIYPFVSTTLRIAVCIAWGAILFGFPLGEANWVAVAGVLIASLLSFSGLGILSASYVLLFKRGNPAKWLFLGFTGLTSGTLFPVSVLPRGLQFFAQLNPVKYALDAMRGALLAGSSVEALWRPVLVLLGFAVVLLPLSMAVFGWSLRRTKATGTLTHR
jgi:ABC-2 type transport system permease protein